MRDPEPSGDPGFADLGFARLDTDRAGRTGDPEVVYGSGKTPAQVVALLAALRPAHPDRVVLATRRRTRRWPPSARSTADATVDEVARCAWVGPLPQPRGRVCVVAAGTSDAPVAAEAAVTARVHGAGVPGSTTSGWPGCTG